VQKRKFWEIFLTQFSIGDLQFHNWENMENQKHEC